jgi:DNA-binding transcriptional ArsR family regulator
MAAKCVKHLVPVGFTPEILVGSIRRFPVDGVILVRGKDKSLPNADKAEEAAKSVRKALGSVPCEDLFVDVDDLEGAALSLAGRIVSERASGCEVLVNLSGSLRSLDIAAYLAAFSTGAHAYIGLPDYAGEKVVGVRKVVSVPVMPLKELSREKRDVMVFLRDRPDGLMLGELIKKSGRLREEADSERSRLSYHISDLKEDGLVETFREGRNIRVKATFAGLMYSFSLEADEGYCAKK